jgi:hypothetical protein
VDVKEIKTGGFYQIGKGLFNEQAFFTFAGLRRPLKNGEWSRENLKKAYLL